MSMFRRSDYEDDDLRAEALAERRRTAYHWCSVCHGHTGPGSPCAPDVEEEPEEESAPDLLALAQQCGASVMYPTGELPRAPQVTFRPGAWREFADAIAKATGAKE